MARMSTKCTHYLNTFLRSHALGLPSGLLRCETLDAHRLLRIMISIVVPLAPILLWAVCRILVAEAAPCSPQSGAWIISDEDEALRLASAIGCSGGIFTVTWVGAIEISEPFVISEGTSLTINGEGDGSSLDGAGTVGPLILVEGVSSELTLRNVEITKGSARDGGAISALTSAKVNIMDCTFSDNDASASGGEMHNAIWVERQPRSNKIAVMHIEESHPVIELETSPIFISC